jgi:chloramphenicol 3-O phosphotransferase
MARGRLRGTLAAMTTGSGHVGRVVVLNGGSSAGKSTIGERFRARRAERGEPWLAIGLDDFNEKVPDDFISVPDFEGPRADEGVRFVRYENGLRPTAGIFARRLFSAYRRTVAAWARAGLDVIVDEVAFDQDAAEDWAEALAGLAVLWVAVRCNAEVAAAREAARGDRAIGLAAGLAEVVHQHLVYDLEIDTASASIEESVSLLDAAVDNFPGFGG